MECSPFCIKQHENLGDYCGLFGMEIKVSFNDSCKLTTLEIELNKTTKAALNAIHDIVHDQTMTDKDTIACLEYLQDEIGEMIEAIHLDMIGEEDCD